MKEEALHPDQLQPGDRVGPWHVLGRLGLGGSARLFKVERDGLPYAMKMALRPVSAGKASEGDAVARRLGLEAAALLTSSPHPNLVRVHAVDCWPHPGRGYPFLVIDLVEGDEWHAWRWKTNPHAAGLSDTFSEVVRIVGMLHARGVYHRDLKAENILIRREDGRPFLVDFGNVRLPGTYARTLGLPPGVLHLLPPELLAYIRSEVWREQVPFQGGVSADLYALGALLYQSLTDHHPFDPRLSDKELMAAISTITPKAPHLLNPRAPRALSDISMRLLEKEPADRYPDTEALLQALWQAGKERASRPWKVPLLSPTETGPLEAMPEEQEAGLSRPREAPARVQSRGEVREEASPEARRTPRLKWLVGLLGVLTLLILGALSGLLSLDHSPAQKGSPAVPHPTPSQDSVSPGRKRVAAFTAWLCAVTSLGCPAAQVKPEPVDCSEEAIEVMSKVLMIQPGGPLVAQVDVNQPAEGEFALYREGPLVGRVTHGEGLLVEGTLLYGYLWTGPGLLDDVGRESVIGRYTRAVLPDGRKFPVCIALGGPHGRMFRVPGSKPGTVQLPPIAPVNGVRRFP